SKVPRSPRAVCSRNVCAKSPSGSVLLRGQHRAMCRDRRTGVAFAYGSNRSSSGRKAHIAYTTGRFGGAIWSRVTNTPLLPAIGKRRGSIPRKRLGDALYLTTRSVGRPRLVSPLLEEPSDVGEGLSGGGGGASTSEKIIPCPVSRAWMPRMAATGTVTSKMDPP